MRLAYLANIRFPSERAHSLQVAHMCQAFAMQGCSVDLYVSKRGVSALKSVKETYGFVETYSVYRLFPKNIYPRLRFTFYTSEFLLALHFVFSTRKEYDIVYSRSEWILLLLSFFFNARVLVWESHEAKYNLAAKTILKRGIRTIVISKGIHDFYIQNNVPKEQLLIADDGIDQSFFSANVSTEAARSELGLLFPQRIVMYIGGLDKWKGVETFMEVQKYCGGVQFVIIGGTDKELAHFKTKYPQVTFLGMRPYKDLARLQQAADILVVPNTAKNQLSSKYTSPLKLFAHMASAKPLVVTDIPSLISVTGRQLVTVCRPDDPVAMAEAILDVYDDIVRKKELAEKLREVAKKYTWTSRANAILAYLEAREVTRGAD